MPPDINQAARNVLRACLLALRAMLERLQRGRVVRRRTMGQRSMQLALVGETDEAAAEAAMLELLPKLVVPQGAAH